MPHATGLSYSLLIAYIAKASTVISSGSGGAVSAEAAAGAFTAVMGSMLWLGASDVHVPCCIVPMCGRKAGKIC